MKIRSIALGTALALLGFGALQTVSAQQAPGFGPPPDGGRFGGHRGGPDGSGWHGRGGPRGGFDDTRLLERLDTNGDGAIDANEFVTPRLAHVDRQFARRDTDGDGLLSREELTPPPPPVGRPEIDRDAVNACVQQAIPDFTPPPAIVDRFDTLDTNDDGSVDVQELSAALQQRAYDEFDRIDADGDGLLTLEELQAAHEQAMTVRGAIRDCVDQIADPLTPDA